MGEKAIVLLDLVNSSKKLEILWNGVCIYDLDFLFPYRTQGKKKKNSCFTTSEVTFLETSVFLCEYSVERSCCKCCLQCRPLRWEVSLWCCHCGWWNNWGAEEGTIMRRCGKHWLPGKRWMSRRRQGARWRGWGRDQRRRVRRQGGSRPEWGSSLKNVGLNLRRWYW